jgi:hypothetical protein
MAIDEPESRMALSNRENEVPCECCERHPDRACPACAARRRHAVRLVIKLGLPIAEAARAMRQSVARVERLLEEAADQRIVETFVQTQVDNAVLRELLAIRQRSDPTLTTAEIARRVGSSQAQVERWLGLRPTAAKTDRRGRTYPGRTLSRISVETAGRLARAMGYAPHDVEGC